MIILKSNHEIDLMKEAGKISARALKIGGEAVEPGVSTEYINNLMHKYIVSQGAKPSFLGYGDFPKSSCISINNEVIHGIPSNDRIIKSGDIVSIDVGAYFHGYNGDNAWTFACGDITSELRMLLDTTKESLFEGIKAAKFGNRIGDIGNTVEEYVKKRGYSVVRDFVGHGVGASIHEEPSVPNYGVKGHGPRLVKGMTIAIEPMVNMGTGKVVVLDDEWTTVTADNRPSAHFEHTVAITQNGAVILTDPS